MFKFFTYCLFASFLLFGMPQTVLGGSFYALPALEAVENKNTDILDVLDQIYIANRTDLAEAVRLSDIAFALLKQAPNKNQHARLLNLTGYRKILSMKPNESLKDILEARRISLEAGNQEEESTSYRLEGVIFILLGGYSEGVDLFYRALSQQQALSSNRTYDTLQNISMAYNSMGDYVNLLKYGYKLLGHPNSIAGSIEEGSAYLTIGLAFTELADFVQAREMLRKAEAIYQGLNSIFLLTAQLALVDVEYRAGNYELALTMLNDNISLAKELGYNVNVNASILLRAKTLIAMDNFSGALITLNELIVLSENKETTIDLQEVYQQLALIYESQGKYQEALESHQKFKEITDELFNDRSATKIALAQTRFEMEQKEKTIALLEGEAALDLSRHSQLEKTTTLRGYIIVLVILMLFGAVIVVFRIIRTRRILERNSENLKNAYRQAEDANNSKSTFLASMSHDLRTPLNAILGYSEAIQLEIKGPLNNPTYQDYISSINTSGKLLLELIDDVLDLSKVEAGKYELVESEISLPAVIMRTLEMIKPVAEEKGITIECDCPDDFPKLLVDERIMVQVLNNLISNSLKFTPKGGTISLSGSHANDGDINISITDNGIGMTEAELIKAMRPFEQINPEFTQSSGGTGLGLTLCIKYMELHGGQLEMSSEKNVGTTTILHFPASRVVA